MLDEAPQPQQEPSNGKDVTQEAPPVDAKPPEQPRPFLAFTFLAPGSGDFQVSRSVDMLTPQQLSSVAAYASTLADLLWRQSIIADLNREAEEARRKAIAVAPPSAFQRVRERFRHGGRPRG